MNISLTIVSSVFPGDVDEEVRLHKGILQSTDENPWMTGSISHLLNLALMCCGGYRKYQSRDNLRSAVKTHYDRNFVTFQFDDTDESLVKSITNIPEGNGIVKGGSRSKNNAYTVVCVEFTNQEEVEILLLETVKTISDFTSINPGVVSEHAMICLGVSY
jgi:hypothetical protein